MSTDTVDRRPEQPEARPTPLPLVLLAWLVVGVPLAYGLYQTVLKALALFVH
ncbi:hypothetical protein HJ590_17210 [Naumannella sp. ID2617S]|uniref:MFS transporter small subunit n=1 Tax=Enemella dayhoffiae TaxID=2016507 RepID=UPI001488E091|nr:hypothetical protein [Enemella dayhoffiae]NNG21262.1 hypothetical protein [Naumannella sp. ID2617S]